jgi:hypothetical protein
MVQHFEKFMGLPEDLITRLNAIKVGGGTISNIITSHVAATYIIIWT